MLSWVIYGMVYLGAALMVYNIYGFVQYARNLRAQKNWDEQNSILYVPIVLLVMFLLGYLAVGLFGQLDLIMAGILFFGSVFVFIMYKYLSSITQRIMENERLEAELMAAEASNEAKVSFLANVSHEMRTPLNVILGMNGLALRDPTLTPETRGRLEATGQSAKHLLGLINNMLDMNRIETGLLATRNEEFSLEASLNQINVIANALCEGEGLVYEPILPELPGCRFMGDEMQLKRVLLSMIDNAVKYTDAPGCVKFSVERVSDEGKLQTFRFVVADTGVGMDPEFVPKVFDTFTKEDAGSTDRYGGGGLSLAVAKRVVELMGGAIAVESRKGEGTTFTVTVPLVCVEASAAGGAPLEPEPLSSLDGARILIVEDLPENAEIVADLLELEGVETEHAENGQIALDMVEQSPDSYYDAILMDLRMPVMDGLEATRRIRALDRPDATRVPIIALTANAFEEDVRQSLEAGMNVHLAKPPDAGLLYETLEQQMKRASEEGGGDAE